MDNNPEQIVRVYVKKDSSKNLKYKRMLEVIKRGYERIRNGN